MKKRSSNEFKSETKAQKVDFKLFAPESQNVFLAADFNNWDPNSHPLKKNSKGEWRISVGLSPGRYECRFLVDGEWRNDPNCNAFTSNPFGGENCVLVLE